MKKLFFIPARGGSKGVPGKNIKPIGGHPLIYYTLRAAEMACGENDVIAVSTDSEDIAKVVNQYGDYVPFMRPDDIATDTASSNEVILHAIHFFEKRGENFDVVVLLQPTSPFRQSGHIKEAIKQYQAHWDMLVSVVETKSNPYYVLFEENTDGFLSRSKKSSFTRRQDCPPVYEFNGAIYIINTSSFKREGSILKLRKVKPFMMNHADSVDIDTKEDWEYAEFLMKKKNPLIKF